MQEACMRLWRAVSGKREIHHVPSYLHRIAATVTIDAVRRVKALREDQIQVPATQRAVSLEAPQANSMAAAEPSPEDAAGHQRLMEMVNETLAGLPENRRRAAVLHLQGFRPVEIANLLGWSEAKARNLAYRGLDDIRRQLRAHGA
jgi:RNA polymerase sigma factor (sigma-70 family)